MINQTWTTRCASGACVTVAETTEGFEFASTVTGNDGSVTYTPAEMAEFLTEVQMGNFDTLRDRARARTDGPTA
jgi:hypothetical protein